jgi:hypothetical protein
MSVKIIALDLDRTTLNSEGKLSEGNRQALTAAINNGIHVCIASGRSFDTLPQDVLEIPGLEYAITGNGAAVYKIKNKECLCSYVLKKESVDEILEHTKKYPVTYEAFIGGTAYTAREFIECPQKFAATKRAVDYVKATRNLKDDIVGFIRENSSCLDSIDIVVRDEVQKQEIMQAIATVSDIYITSSVSQLVEISYKDAGKHSGLKFLAGYLGIEPSDIAAFGDADNDYDMLKYAGTGIAMENASERLLSVADYVTLHHDKDGVAYALKNILKCI